MKFVSRTYVTVDAAFLYKAARLLVEDLPGARVEILVLPHDEFLADAGFHRESSTFPPHIQLEVRVFDDRSQEVTDLYGLDELDLWGACRRLLGVCNGASCDVTFYVGSLQDHLGQVLPEREDLPVGLLLISETEEADSAVFRGVRPGQVYRHKEDRGVTCTVLNLYLDKYGNTYVPVRYSEVLGSWVRLLTIDHLLEFFELVDDARGMDTVSKAVESGQ